MPQSCCSSVQRSCMIISPTSHFCRLVAAVVARGARERLAHTTTNHLPPEAAWRCALLQKSILRRCKNSERLLIIVHLSRRVAPHCAPAALKRRLRDTFHAGAQRIIIVLVVNISHITIPFLFHSPCDIKIIAELCVTKMREMSGRAHIV